MAPSLAMSLKIEEEYRIAGGVEKPGPVQHAGASGPNSVHENHNSAVVRLIEQPSADSRPGAAREGHRFGRQIGRRLTDCSMVGVAKEIAGCKAGRSHQQRDEGDSNDLPSHQEFEFGARCPPMGPGSVPLPEIVYSPTALSIALLLTPLEWFWC